MYYTKCIYNIDIYIYISLSKIKNVVRKPHFILYTSVCSNSLNKFKCVESLYLSPIFGPVILSSKECELVVLYNVKVSSFGVYDSLKKLRTYIDNKMFLLYVLFYQMVRHFNIFC